MTEPLRLLDLFSGIGGFSLGLERTGGFRTVAFCEVSPVCRRLLAHHWPEVPCYDDVRTLSAERLAADGIVVDAICGGFPCQDISFAGRGAGIAGERSGLWAEYARLIGELRPRVVFVENVAALLGRGLGVVLGDLAALGYDAWWDCIPASAVGAPHRRDRLWLVAYPRGVEHEGRGDAIRRAVAAGLHAAALGHDADGQQQGPIGGLCGRANPEPGRSGAHVADAECGRLQGAEPAQPSDLRRRPANPGEALADSPCVLLNRGRVAGQGRGRQPTDGRWWFSEPDVGRVAHGVPARVDRLHGLGNAVVPQIPELIGRAVLQSGIASFQHREAA